MSTEALTALVAGASGVFGALVVAVSNYVLNRAQARDAHTEALRGALRDLLYVIARVELQLRREPRPGRAARWYVRQWERYLPQLHDALGTTSRRLFAPNFDALMDRFHEAHAAIMVIAPLYLMPQILAVTELMGRADQRDEAWWQEWSKATGKLIVACRKALGEPVGESKPRADGE